LFDQFLHLNLGTKFTEKIGFEIDIQKQKEKEIRKRKGKKKKKRETTCTRPDSSARGPSPPSARSLARNALNRCHVGQ
jgi:hypothetical protein